MQSILAAECTGCELCIPPCPVDCISMAEIALEPLPRAEILGRADRARRRFDARNRRLDGERAARDARRTASQIAANRNSPPISKTAVLEAIARGKARRKTGADGTSRS
jgi:electron transport complex protein RnfB